MKQKIITRDSFIEACLISLLLVFSACNSLTKHKAFIFLKKNDATYGVLYYARLYDKKVYKDGSMGYVYTYDSYRDPGTAFADNMYLLSEIGDPVYTYSGYGLVDYCTHFSAEQLSVGYHNTGKCVGKWYTFTRYCVKVTPKCRNKYRKYINPEDIHKDTVNIEYFHLNKVQTYKDGFLDGDFICYDIDGTVMYKTKFIHGTGYYKNFRPPNGISEEGAYVNGFQEGKWISYHAPPDRDTSIYYFNKGVEIEQK